LFAGVLINGLLMARLERFAASLPVAVKAATAHGLLRDMPPDASAPARPLARAEAAAADSRRLNVRGPLALAAGAVLLFVVAGLGAAYTRLGDLAALAGGTIFETRITSLQFAPLAPTARMHVAVGAEVRTGDLLATRDTTDLDQQIEMLRALEQAARSQLVQVNRETADLGASGMADKAQLATLEQRVGDLEQEGHELVARITAAEDQLAKSRVRAPVSGRVVALGVPSTGDALATPGAIRLDIATADRPLLYRLLELMTRNLHPAAPQTLADADARNER
jgi:hypothetical protein